MWTAIKTITEQYNVDAFLFTGLEALTETRQPPIKSKAAIRVSNFIHMVRKRLFAHFPHRSM